MVDLYESVNTTPMNAVKSSIKAQTYMDCMHQSMLVLWKEENMLDERTYINEINRQTYNDDIHDVATVGLLKYYQMDQTYWKLRESRFLMQ